MWLFGVRRVGKTLLTQSLPDALYLDCELPRVRRQLEDPQSFLEGVRGKRIVLDEVHRLADPAQILKIAADHFPTTRIVATGSSTLGSSARFKDTLTGRKAEVWLTPMCEADRAAFPHPDLARRLLRGGLPSWFLAPRLPEPTSKSRSMPIGPRTFRSSSDWSGGSRSNDSSSSFSPRAGVSSRPPSSPHRAR